MRPPGSPVKVGSGILTLVLSAFLRQVLWGLRGATPLFQRASLMWMFPFRESVSWISRGGCSFEQNSLIFPTEPI